MVKQGMITYLFFSNEKSIKLYLKNKIILFSDGYYLTYQKNHPRFQGENLDKNKNIYERIESLAKKHQATPAQLALAWVLEQGEDVSPIPGE